MKYACLFVSLMLLPACNSIDPDQSTDTNLRISKHASSMTSVSFGDPYEITTSANSGFPSDVTIPTLRDGVLTLWVSFGGGCEVHEFTLGQVQAADKVQLWFTHEANSDGCEAYLTEKIEISLSGDIADGLSVELLDPNGDPFALRD